MKAIMINMNKSILTKLTQGFALYKGLGTFSSQNLYNHIYDHYRWFITNHVKREFCNISDNERDLIDVLDEYGIRTGEILPRKEIHELGKVHRAVHLYLLSESNELLLQRRSYNTDHYPGMLSISMTGHVDAGESSSDALRRELREELGFNATDMKINFLFSFRQDVEVNPKYIDRQFNDVYVCQCDFKIEDILFDHKEVSEVKLVHLSKFQEMIVDEKGELAPVYARECSDVMYFLKK